MLTRLLLLLQAAGSPVMDPRLLRDPRLAAGAQAVVPGATPAGQPTTYVDYSHQVQAAASPGSPVLLVVVAVVMLALGIAIGVALSRALSGTNKRRGKPAWPRDWPKDGRIFTTNPDPTKRGYLALTPSEAMGSGAMPLGRTYPRLAVFPDKYPFFELRRRVQWMFSKPVWVPPMKRLQHFFVLGKTGGGKSTAFAVPVLAYGALEKGSAYFAIDVKSPAFVRYFAALYKKAGKDVVFFDPWSIEESLAFEPLWRASDERKDIIADVIATYSTEPGSLQESGNSEFFKVSSIRLMRGLIELAGFWPRRYCNLPCVQQLVGSGGNVIKEAFEKVGQLMPTLDELLAATEQVLGATAEQVRARPRPEVLEGALAVLDRSGYRIAFLVKQMRRYDAAARDQQPIEFPLGSGAKARVIEPAELDEVRRAFWASLKHEWLERRKRLDQMLMNQGEFINSPDDTRNSTVSTLTNRVGWFRDQNIARAFSRDEIDVHTLIERPCLFLVGAPMAKLKVGSLFCSSLLSNLALNAVFQRGMAIEKNDKGVSKHHIFFLLDEFPQLQIKEAPQILATFRGFLSGLVMIFQERGQLKQLYGENATTMEANTIHKVLLAGAHPDTAEFFSKAMGNVQVETQTESGAAGEKKNISKQMQSVPLMEVNDIIDMRLNGEEMPGMALSVGTDVPAFPLLPTPFYEDPTLRKLLGLRRTVSRKGYSKKDTWKFWQWSVRWEWPETGLSYLTRQKALSPVERSAGKPDPVFDRQQDPYAQYLDYLLGRPKGQYDELSAPVLVLADVGVTENDPAAAALAAAEGQPAAAAQGGVSLGKPAPTGPAVPASLLVPTYGTDFRHLINDDFQGADAIPVREPAGGSLEERLEAAADEE